MTKPKISVLMPVYNAEKYVAEAIDSILNQTFTDFELIIIDDASTDGSYAILQSFKDKRIRLFKNEINLNKSDTRNKGIEYARGKYLALMDADDISRPHRLQMQYDFMEQNSDIDLCGAYTHLFGLQDFVCKYPLEPDKLRDQSLYKMPFTHPVLMIRDVAYKNMRYKKEHDGIEDYLLICELLQTHKGGTIPEVLLDYRIHGNQASFTLNDSQELEVRSSQILQHFEVLKINLRRKYPHHIIDDNIIHNENFFCAKNVLSENDFASFSKYYAFLIDTKTETVYSKSVIQKLFVKRVIESFIEAYQISKAAFVKRVFIYMKGENALKLPIMYALMNTIMYKIKHN